MKKIIILLALPMLLTACDALTGKEVGRLKINQVSTEKNITVKEVVLDLKKDTEIKIWSDIDVSYEGDAELRFRIEILKNGEKYNQLEIDPMKKNVTMGEVKTSFNGKTNWKFSGKNGELKIEDNGKYTFKGILVASENSTLNLTKAELVLKE